MHKTELIERMAERFPQLLFKDSENAVNLIIDELIVALATGDRVSFQRFGSFETREVPKRTRTNPRNGDPVEVPAKRVVKFNAGEELRERCGLPEYLRERASSWGNKENVGVDVLEKYSNHPDRRVIGAILENEKCTPELVAKLAGRMASSTDPADRLILASAGKSCPPQLIEQLCSDEDENVRAKAAEHCSPEMLETVANDKSGKVRESVARRGDLPEKLAVILAKDKLREVRWNIAFNHRQNVAVASVIATDSDETIRERLVWVDIPVEVLDVLAGDTSPRIRIAVAKRNCSFSAFSQLAKDHDARVREAVAINDSCPQEFLERLMHDEDSSVRVGVARNEKIPNAWLQEMANDMKWDVRGWVTNRPDCPVSVLTALAQDSNYWVRKNVAGNDNTPEHVLRTLVNDDSEWVRDAVAGNAKCPDDVLRILENDTDPMVWGTVRMKLR